MDNDDVAAEAMVSGDRLLRSLGELQAGPVRVSVAVSGDVAPLVAGLLAGFPPARPDPASSVAVPAWEVAATHGPARPARFDLRRDGIVLLRCVELGVAVEHLMWHLTQAAIHATSPAAALHAGAVSGPHGAVLLPAPAGSGKTTLTAGLVAAGWDYLSDELALVEPETAAVRPFARPLCLARDAVELFAGLGDRLTPKLDSRRCDKLQVRPEDLRPGARRLPGQACPVRAVVLPLYEPAAPTRVEPLRRVETLLALLPNAFDLDPGRLEVLAELCRSAPGYRLVSGDLDEAVAEVSRLAEAAGADRQGAVAGRVQS